MKITIGINSLVSTVHAAYGNHLQAFFNLGRKYKNIEFVLNNPARMSIDRMRNMTATVALQTESDHILFLDDDVLIPLSDDHQWLNKLIKCGADIVAGDVLIRSYPFDHMIFKYNVDGNLISLSDLPNTNNKPFLADAVGFSCCLIKTDILSRISKPYFVTTPNHSTEDIYFCLKAKDAIPNIKIMCEPTVRCGHILWEEVISGMNKDNYKEYFEKQYDFKELNKDENIDRGEEYYKQVKEKLNAVST